MMKRLAWTVLLAPAAWGCSSKLDTGYEPRRLGATSTERRAYYASPYTPEAVAAQQSGPAPDYSSRRPSVGR